MRRVTVLAMVAAGGFWCWPGGVEAADPEVAVALVPMRYAFVDGDVEKFRAHHWMKEGYAGGVKEFLFRHTLPDGTFLSAEGHAFPSQNDFGTDVELKKDTLGFFNLEYSEFRKYFDGNGGTHRRFSTFQTIDADEDLALDIGKLGVETGLTLEGWPELSFAYEREFKDGAKSRLTWTSVTEAGEARKIGPSWQDIDEIVDAFALTANHELAGFALRGEQRWEFARSETVRHEVYRSTNATASESLMRTQDQAPESTLMTTTLGAERHFLNEKVFLSTGYHFAHLDSREYETLIEMNAAGVVTNFSRAENKFDSRADNDYDSHTWVGNLTTQLGESLSFGTKLKSEVIKRQSNSTYPAYSEYVTSPEAFDLVVDHTEANLTDTKAARWGEGFSLRFTGLPRTALYTELEFEQSRVLMREDRQSLDGPDTGNDAVATEVFMRETVTDVRRGVWTLGGRSSPWPFLDLTAHVRRRVNNNDYDDQRETVASGARSAFIDEQNIHTNEFVTRFTLRPCRWFRSSVRYQYRDDDYSTRAESQDTVKTGTRSHIYTYDVTLQPLKELVTTASFSRQNAATTTPARYASTPSNIPTFNADVSSWLFSADYAPKPNLTWTSSLLYSRAQNFNDFADTGMPFGADFHRLDLTTGIAWSPSDQTSLGLDYALYTYNPNENVESGDYTAHVIWLEVTQQF
ncbi:MAG: hypothetical protein HYY91_05275 [Candidatus Omnitrophica bacterium]|nr:hypothetical protein [Candidatus Omnitrophota bacterium]